MIEEALVEQINQIASIYPLNAPENQKAPYIVFLSSDIEETTLDGFLTLKTVSFEFNILHSSYKKMKELTKQVVDKLKVLSEVGDYYIQELTFGDNAEIYESEISLYRKVLNFTIYFEEA